ncbi:hypothetical protein SLS58_008644 [Diplodia intermedia]|uniref:Uncharacterized protein n=1 Tax=Diplodia intermedia TaxID=856260 RepID=A0ABR3TGT1_9PEZI
MATQDQDTKSTTQDTSQEIAQDTNQDATQDTQPQETPSAERIQVRVALDVAKGNGTQRYWEFLDIAFPDTYRDFCNELTWLHWRVQSIKHERWVWTVSPSVFWTDVPCPMTMDADNWARVLRFIRQREKGDYLRLSLNCESVAARRS